jgi:hypothetical protein
MSKKSIVKNSYLVNVAGRVFKGAYKLIVKHFYTFRHRDYGEVTGQLTMWDFASGHMEAMTENGDFLPMNIKFVEEIYAQ